MLPPPALGGPLNLTGRVRSLAARIPRVVRCAVCQGATAALTLAKLQLPRVNLGAVALGIPKDTSDKALETAEDTVAPLVAAAMNIIDDASLLVDDFPDEVEGPAAPPSSP